MTFDFRDVRKITRVFDSNQRSSSSSRKVGPTSAAVAQEQPAKWRKVERYARCTATEQEERKKRIKLKVKFTL